MTNRFEVQVVALDRFTKTFRNLNNQAGKAARPLVNIHRQVGALAKEMHLDKAAKGLGKVSDAAVTLTRTLGISLGPLESVLGAGGIVGGLLAAGAGAVALGVRFASAGFEVNRTSQRLGVSTDNLQRYRGAMRLGGVDADAFTANLEALGTILQDAKFGRNPLALQMLNKFGLSVHTGADGVIDTITTMKELSGVLQKVADPHVRAIIAGAFGLQDALPVLMQGPDAIEKLAKEAERLGIVAGPQALKWSEDFTTSLNHLKVAADGVANSIGSRMVPVLSRGLDAATGRLTQSHESPLRAMLGFDSDVGKFVMRKTGIFPLFDKVSGLFGDAGKTTPAQRSVSGQIGGPLQPGAYQTPVAAPVSGAGAPTPGGGLIGGRYVDPAVQAERDRVAMRMVQSELANSTNAADRAALTRELAARSAGAASGTLTPQKVQVEVAFKNAPPGTTATARSKTENAYMPTLISYSIPGDGP